MTNRAHECEHGTGPTVLCFMPTVLPPPERDPDGTAQYAPALTGVNNLLEKRRNTGGCSLAEPERLETIARDLQALARGF